MSNITAEDMKVPVQPGFEEWQNNTETRVFIIRIGAYGVQTHDMILAHQPFFITPQERRINESKSATPAQNVFTNGTFSPLSLLPDEYDTPRLLANPNNVTRDDFADIFKLRGQNFLERIEVITALPTIDDLLARAKEPSNKVLVEQYEMLGARRARIVQANAPKDPEIGPTGERAPKAVTPH